MSRIQNLLNKAERDGTVRRTRGLVDEAPIGAPAAGSPAPDVRPDVRPIVPTPMSPAPRPRLDVVEPVRFESPAPAPPVDWSPDPAPSSQPTRLDPHLIAALAPSSLAAEQYRSLRARIRRAEVGRTVKTILITSPAKGDGKSLTAANLALTMSQEFQQRVLLLDADLRRPSVHELFALGEGPGLGDVLMGASELDDALVNLPEHHLTVLRAGVPPNHPTELLGSAAMRRVVDLLRARFDKILIDMPPVAPLADAHVVAPMADGVLMVVRAGVTPKPAIERALNGLDLTKVLGLVLNDSAAPGTDYDYETYGGYRYVAG
jgi:capsular exopolysaccharide synthesis family protein